MTPFSQAGFPTDVQTTAFLEQHYGAFYRHLRTLTGATVHGVVISGSGLNTALEEYTATETVDLNDIKGFPTPSVEGHSSSIRFITIGGKQLAHFTGRCHLYEGWTMQQSLAQIGLARLMGAQFAVLTNSAGGMYHAFVPGDIMLISDSLNLMNRPVQRSLFTGANSQQTTAVRHNIPTNAALDCDYGRVASGDHIFSATWRTKTAQHLAASGVPFHQGVYVGVTGPTYETPAEARMYRAFGGQAIGMSTVHEAEFARLCGMQVAGCSLITNVLPESAAVNISHDEVMQGASAGAPRVAAFIASACAVVEMAKVMESEA
jgi:inosine/guanosine/xanthosine phosphorylase family protein